MAEPATVTLEPGEAMVTFCDDDGFTVWLKGSHSAIAEMDWTPFLPELKADAREHWHKTHPANA